MHLSASCHPTRMVEISSCAALLPPKKNQSFILRVRKYELRVAEPFILCRTLAAYYFTLPMYGNYNSFTKHLFGSHVKKAGPSASGTQQQFYEVGDKLMDSHCFLLFFAISSKLLKSCANFVPQGPKVQRFSSYIVHITVKHDRF